MDDRAENLVALEGILAAPDYNLVKTTSGFGALELILKQDFALILLDVHMPVMDGFETARLIKQRAKSRHIPIIFLTAMDRDEKFISRGYAADCPYARRSSRATAGPSRQKALLDMDPLSS